MDTLFSTVKLDAAGLVAVVAQDGVSGQVLMLAWANEAALRTTLSSGFAHYWSRSRGSLWKKGESSGHLQRVREVRVDCDGDTVLYVVDQEGPACHTGAPTCFFRRVDEVGALAEAHPAATGPPHAVLRALAAAIEARKLDRGTKSYTKSLFDAGAAKIATKIMEEAGETAAALLTPESDENLVHEVADLWFHSLVGLASRGLGPDDVLRELGRRFGVSGHEEKASRSPKPPTPTAS